MTVMPARVIIIEIRIIPRVVPYMAIESPTIPIRTHTPMRPPVMAIVEPPMVIPMIPAIPAKRITHHIIPIIPVTGGGKYVGIHAIIVNIPIPTRP